MKTKLNLVLAFALALAGGAAGCDDDEGPSVVDGGGGRDAGGNGGAGAAGGTGGTNPDGGVPDGGDNETPSFGAFVIDLIKNKTNETGAPESLEGRTFDMSANEETFVELLK